MSKRKIIYALGILLIFNACKQQSKDEILPELEITEATEEEMNDMFGFHYVDNQGNKDNCPPYMNGDAALLAVSNGVTQLMKDQNFKSVVVTAIQNSPTNTVLLSTVLDQKEPISEKPYREILGKELLKINDVRKTLNDRGVFPNEGNVFEELQHHFVKNGRKYPAQLFINNFNVSNLNQEFTVAPAVPDRFDILHGKVIEVKNNKVVATKRVAIDEQYTIEHPVLTVETGYGYDNPGPVFIQNGGCGGIIEYGNGGNGTYGNNPTPSNSLGVGPAMPQTNPDFCANNGFNSTSFGFLSMFINENEKYEGNYNRADISYKLVEYVLGNPGFDPVYHENGYKSNGTIDNRNRGIKLNDIAEADLGADFDLAEFDNHMIGQNDCNDGVSYWFLIFEYDWFRSERTMTNPFCIQSNGDVCSMTYRAEDEGDIYYNDNTAVLAGSVSTFEIFAGNVTLTMNQDPAITDATRFVISNGW